MIENHNGIILDDTYASPEGKGYFSFTRNKNLDRINLSTIRLTIDGNRLSQRYKIEPYMWTGSDTKLDVVNYEAEERINAKRYGGQIDITPFVLNVTLTDLDTLKKQYTGSDLEWLNTRFRNYDKVLKWCEFNKIPVTKITTMKESRYRKNLREAKYEEIFSPETIQLLNADARAAYQALGKTIMQNLQLQARLLPQIVQAESDYTDLLEEIAKEIVTQAYPIIKQAGIKIEAKITGQAITPSAGKKQEPEEKPKEKEPQIQQPDIPGDTVDLEKKRRVINGITQGAAIRGTFALLLFREYIDDLDPTLVDNYTTLMKNVFGVYDDDEGLAMLLAMLAARGAGGAGGGEVETEEDENGKFVIKAQAMTFPMLVHEIEKGLYEILSLYGFSNNPEKNKAVVSKVDKLENEPEDMRYGKYIFDRINSLYVASKIDDPLVRDFFLQELYQLAETEFLEFIENLLNNRLTSEQKRWAMQTMKDIESDLRKDATGLEDLD
jgi:hypothetical protein